MYEEQILKILSEVGQRGISVALLTKHIYNLNCTLFAQPDLQELRQSVQQYLLRNSKLPKSLIENTGKRGVYRLNTSNSADARQLMLNFTEAIETDTEEDQQAVEYKDLSLNLFAEEPDET